MALTACPSNPLNQKWDAFITSRGKDTSYGLLSHLVKAFEEKKINVFIDDKFPKGEEISALLEIIENSYVSVVIFSENYADSSWCLDELVKILECRRTSGQPVLPVFYKVDPTDIQKLTGSFGKAFHELRKKSQDQYKVDGWSQALDKISNLSGWDSRNFKSESELVEEIVDGVFKKLSAMPSNDFSKKVDRRTDFQKRITKKRRLVEITPLHAIKPMEPTEKIRVRVCRIWKTKSVTTNKLISFDCLLVDKKNDAIQATMKPFEVDFFPVRLQEGAVYDISNFYVANNKEIQKVVPHPCMLEFAKATLFCKLEDNHSEIPSHRFYFLDYDDIENRVDANNLLTDVIGQLLTVGGIEEAYIGCRLELKRNLIIQNLEEKKLNVTLWGDLANEFNENIVQSSTKPVIMVFAAMTVKRYIGKLYVGSSSSTMYFFNPEIHEVHQYKRRFENFPQHVEFLRASENKPLHPDEQKMINKKKISELLTINPDENKNIRFTCKASIMNFDVNKGWWYASCPECNKKAKQNGTYWWCAIHGQFKDTPEPWYKLHCILQDDTGALNVTIFGQIAEALIGKSCRSLTMEEFYRDQRTLPPYIDQLKGSTKIFQLCLGQKIITEKPNFLVSKFFEDDGHSPIASSKQNQPQILSL